MERLKKHYFYPHFLDKGWVPPMWIVYAFYKSIINCQNVDKSKGGGVKQCG